MIVDIIGLLELVAIGAETVEAVSNLLAAIGVEVNKNYEDLTPEEKLTTLKKCTIIVTRLHMDINCMPMGEATAICFDTDGNPIP